MLSCQYGLKPLRSVVPHFVESVPQTIKAVLRAKGGPTWYWQGIHNTVTSECMSVPAHVTHWDAKMEPSHY